MIKMCKRKYMVKILIGLMLLLSISACDVLPFEINLDWLNRLGAETDTATPELPPVDATQTDPLAQTPTPGAPPESLIIWLPPDMDPAEDTPSGALLKAQLAAFSAANGDIEIITRVKNARGSGGLLDALTATNLAAPDIMPDLISLSRSDLETASLKALVVSLDGKTLLIDSLDWFPYAREMALIQGSLYGIPFTGDALGIIYRNDLINPPPNTWEGLSSINNALAFAANDPMANFSLALYQAAGGTVQDAQRRPMLEVEPLTEVLNLFADLVDTSSFSDQVMQLQNEEQVWLAFKNEQARAAVVSVSTYLRNETENSAMVTIPPIEELSLTTGSGWVWAVATANPQRQALCLSLLEQLSDSQFLAEWNEAFGGMPPRPSSLDSWQDPTVRSLLSQVSVMTVLKSSNPISINLGPIIRDAVIQVLRDGIDPAVAAQNAVESVQ